MTAETTPIPQEAREFTVPNPVLSSWYEAYKHGNRQHPQTVYGIATLVGKAVTSSLRSGAVDLSYAARSQLTLEQLKDLKEATVHAHRAFGITVIPNGYAQKGETVFDPDFWFNGTWSDMKRTFVRSLAYMGASAHPYDIDKKIDDLPVEVRNRTPKVEWKIKDDYVNSSTANKLADSIKHKRDNVEWKGMQSLVDMFQQSPEYQSTLPIVSGMYEAAVRALETDESRELVRRRRETYSKKNRQASSDNNDFAYTPRADDYELQLIKLMKEELDVFAKQTGIADTRIYDFLNAVSNLPRWD